MSVKRFEEYISEGIVRAQQLDLSRANFLTEEAKKSYLTVNTIVQKMSIDDINANSVIKLCYDIIMELIRASMLKKGFKAAGYWAHEAEVSYLRNLGFNEKDVWFVDQMRYSRNSITYYGKILDKEYGEKVVEFLQKIYPVLLRHD